MLGVIFSFRNAIDRPRHFFFTYNIITIIIISSLCGKTGSCRYAKIFTTVIIHPHRVMFINSRHGMKSRGYCFRHKRVRRGTPTVVVGGYNGKITNVL